MNPQALKVLFAGTPEFAARHLQALIDSPHQVLAVYTQPDRPAGRGKKLKPSEVKQLALSNKLPVLQPLSLKNTEAQAELAAFNADVIVVVAYGLLLPVPVLQAPRLGCLNVHGSILPRWRGAAPIQRAIEAGDSCSGVTIMQMDEGLDTGDMLIKAECPILDTDTSSDLHDRLAELGPTALLETLARLDNLQPQKQDEQLACYARKIEKAEAEIDWRLPATTLHRRIRAFNPFPVCYTTLADQRLKIHAADIDPASGQPGEVLAADKNQLLVACGEQSLSIQKLQLPGKKPMSAAEFANGHSQLCAVGSRLGASL